MKPCASSSEWIGGRGKFIEANCEICGYEERRPICNYCVVNAPQTPYENLIILLTKEGTKV